MSTINKQLIKNLNNGKNLDKVLPDYMHSLAQNYRNQAFIRCAMQYYVMYEQYADGMFIEEEVKNTVNFITDMMENVFVNKDSFKKEDGISKIESARHDVIQKMEVLTNYTDQITIYEYVLNRLEHKFDGAVIEEDATIFTQELMQYIFGVKDNFVINEKIKDVISQLPVRMARSKFYELIKNSISLYKGGQKESLESYLYMLRTSAMLYKPEGEGKYFKDWGAFVEKLKETDYAELTKETFDELSGELMGKAANIMYTSEMFVSLQELMNSLYVFILMDGRETLEKEECEDTLKTCEEIIQAIQDKLKNGDVLSFEMEDKLYQLEGVPEKIAQQIAQLEGSLDMVTESYKDKLTEYGLEPLALDLEKAQTLLSESLFVEFKEESLQEVTEEMAEKETKRLLDEFGALFQNHSIKVVRAVIAGTIARMPVFFANTEEVSEYILSSLEQCKDAAEKTASYEILRDVIKEDK